MPQLVPQTSSLPAYGNSCKGLIRGLLLVGCLRGRTYQRRRRDMLMMLLTHNIAILLYVGWG